MKPQRYTGMPFTVIDPKTGEYPDCEQIALKEEWAQGLIYCDIDGFWIGENGNLILVDDCGNARWCPADRFIVEPIRLPVKHERTLVGDYRCPVCNVAFIDGAGRTAFCGACGTALQWPEDKEDV